MSEILSDQSPLWIADAQRLRDSKLLAFRNALGDRLSPPDLGKLDATDYAELHAYSLRDQGGFWSALWDFCAVIGDKGEPWFVADEELAKARFFPTARLNFAENLLRRDDATTAIVFWGEDQYKSSMSWRELNTDVAALAAGLRAQGVVAGDRVCCVLPNQPETVVLMLATASIGAVFSSASPDFGVSGIVDRFAQIEPKVLVGVDSYLYNHKRHDCIDKLEQVAAQLGTVELHLTVQYAGGALRGQSFEQFVAKYRGAKHLFVAMEFDAPLYILFSSGTTGVPKCIVHRAGGVLLKHLSEHVLHGDMHEGERLLYATTCGWMMWNWQVSALACGVSLVLYDGAPLLNQGDTMFDLIDAEAVDVFGTSAKFIDALAKQHKQPRVSHKLDSVRMILSTGSPLLAEAFDYVYRDIKTDVHLASISGGTDIVGCFFVGVPSLPVYRGQLQAVALGVAAEIWDSAGQALDSGRGELVCTAPMPSMPLGFWNDPTGARYKAAYFEVFENTWCHGDFVEKHPSGGYIIHGRSDATLNPGGVRIGTAEIYRQVEKIDAIVESIAIGLNKHGDCEVILYVVLREAMMLDSALIGEIKQQIRQHTTPRHVPGRIIQVADIPRTRSGKLVELTVSALAHGREVVNQHALANPEALKYFKQL